MYGVPAEVYPGQRTDTQTLYGREHVSKVKMSDSLSRKLFFLATGNQTQTTSSDARLHFSVAGCSRVEHVYWQPALCSVRQQVAVSVYKCGSTRVAEVERGRPSLFIPLHPLLHPPPLLAARTSVLLRTASIGTLRLERRREQHWGGVEEGARRSRESLRERRRSSSSKSFQPLIR